MFPPIENCLTMTLREWLYWHNVMHRHYTHYLGRKVLKPPFDWFVLGDILYETKPEVVIEIGSYEGGTTLWMAHQMDSMEFDGNIIGIDITEKCLSVKHPRITWVIGNALDSSTIARVEELCAGRQGMVVEDSDHKYHVTKAILESYCRFVAVDRYFIVEDTIVEFLNLPPFPGPLRAVQEFVSDCPQFVIDRTREKYLMTYNPMGYLLRVSGERSDVGSTDEPDA
jgi:cephalosporin hydroxylase